MSSLGLMRILSCLLVVGFISQLSLSADEASHASAVQKLITVMEMEKNHEATLENLLQAQTRQNPAMIALQPTMREFLNKYMSWALVKDDMAKIYQEAFSEAELGQLSDFYASDIGKKAMKTMPMLMGKGMQKAQEKMQPHLPELQAALKAAAEKQGLGPQGGPTAPPPAAPPAK